MEHTSPRTVEWETYDAVRIELAEARRSIKYLNAELADLRVHTALAHYIAPPDAEAMAAIDRMVV